MYNNKHYKKLIRSRNVKNIITTLILFILVFLGASFFGWLGNL